MTVAVLFTLALQASALDDAQLAEMHRAYEQSCVQRDYGAFDDICNQLADQIAAYERHRPAPADAPPPPVPPSKAPPPSAAFAPAPSAPRGSAGTDAGAGR